MRLAPIVAVTAGVVPAIVHDTLQVRGRGIALDTLAVVELPGYTVRTVVPLAFRLALAKMVKYLPLAGSFPWIVTTSVGVVPVMAVISMTS